MLARPDNMDIHVHFVRARLDQVMWIGHVRFGGGGRIVWTVMSILSGRGRPDNVDIDVHFVRAGPAGQYGHRCPFCPGEPGRTIPTSMSIFYVCPGRLWANASTVGTELRSLTMIQGASLLTCQPVKHWFLLPGGGLPVYIYT